jgi:hypothetical protein
MFCFLFACSACAVAARLPSAGSCASVGDRTAELRRLRREAHEAGTEDSSRASLPSSGLRADMAVATAALSASAARCRRVRTMLDTEGRVGSSSLDGRYSQHETMLIVKGLERSWIAQLLLEREEGSKRCSCRGGGEHRRSGGGGESDRERRGSGRRCSGSDESRGDICRRNNSTRNRAFKSAYAPRNSAFACVCCADAHQTAARVRRRSARRKERRRRAPPRCRHEGRGTKARRCAHAWHVTGLSAALRCAPGCIADG